MNNEDYKLYQALSERVTDIAKNYRVLNENHHNTELKLTKLETKVNTAVSIVKWVLSPMAVISLAIKIAELAGWL